MKFKVFFYDGLDYSTGEFYSAQESMRENFIEFEGNELIPIDECSIILLSTGLKDKNGKEIYEGDILSDWMETDQGHVASHCQVYFDEKHGQWYLDLSYNQDKSHPSPLWLELDDFEYKIVGNIFQFSHLLVPSNSN